MIDNPELVTEKRKGSREVWQKKYNAERNYEDFAQQLKKIMAFKL